MNIQLAQLPAITDVRNTTDGRLCIFTNIASEPEAWAFAQRVVDLAKTSGQLLFDRDTGLYHVAIYNHRNRS